MPSFKEEKKGRSHTLLKQNGNLPKITMTTDDGDDPYPETDYLADELPGFEKEKSILPPIRKQSTSTLNRLVLVAQALESEVNSRRQEEVSGTRIVCTIRMANLVLLSFVNALILTGVGQYHSLQGGKQSLLITINKWYYDWHSDLPLTFSEMKLLGQFFSISISILLWVSTFIMQCLQCCRISHSRIMCLIYAFGSVPLSLFVFGIEMHYSACPWIDEFFSSDTNRIRFMSGDQLYETQCGVNGWALAGIFALLSCGLYVSEGLINTFFRNEDSHVNNEKSGEAIL